MRGWLEARAVRIDKVVGDLAAYLDDPKPAAVSTVTTDCIVSAARAVPRSDGFFDVYLDSLRPFQLPPMLGRLFQLLAEDTGHEIDDGLVGFKSNGHLVTKLNDFARLTYNGAGQEKRRRDTRLNQALSELRSRVNRYVANGDRLVQTRRNVGFRIAVRKP